MQRAQKVATRELLVRGKPPMSEVVICFFVAIRSITGSVEDFVRPEGLSFVGLGVSLGWCLVLERVTRYST
jgi:hypothetical protein